jgi:hypothetical protein
VTPVVYSTVYGASRAAMLEANRAWRSSRHVESSNAGDGRGRTLKPSSPGAVDALEECPVRRARLRGVVTDHAATE